MIRVFSTRASSLRQKTKRQTDGRRHCVKSPLLRRGLSKVKVKVKVKWIYIAPSREISKAFRHGSHSVTCNYTTARFTS